MNWVKKGYVKSDGKFSHQLGKCGSQHTQWIVPLVDVRGVCTYSVLSYAAQTSRMLVFLFSDSVAEEIVPKQKENFQYAQIIP